MKGKIRSLVLCAAIFFASASQGKVNLPEALTSRDEQIQYLLYLQSEIPVLFEQGAEYDVNFLNLIEDQNLLVAALQRNSDYLRLTSLRPPLSELTIGFMENTKAGHTGIAVEAFEKAVTDAALSIDENFQSAWNAILPRIVEAQHLQGLMTGIIGAYPGDLKGKGFKLKTHFEKLKFLQDNPLEDSVLKAKFKFDRFGLNPVTTGWNSLVSMAEKWVRLELEAGQLVLNYCQKQACAELLGQEETWLKSIGENKLSADQKSALDKIRQSLSAQFSSKQGGSQAKTEFVPALRLVEVPPDMGIFRGLVGGDCSTNMSFPFVYMPNERTYYIYSASGTVLGYLQGTVANDPRGTPHFYVHSISGGSLSHRHVNLALHGLSLRAKELGFKSILLPPRESIFKNINYVAIHEPLYQLLAQSTTDLVYPDNTLRVLVASRTLGFKHGVRGDYDLQEANPLAHHVILNDKMLKEIHVEMGPSRLAKRDNTKRELTQSDSVLAALDLLAGEQSKTAQNTLREQIAVVQAGVGQAAQMRFTFRHAAATEILRPWGLGLEADGSMAIHSHLNNLKGLRLKDYYGAVRDAFKELGVELTDKLIDGRPYLFNEGHLSAPDAVTTKEETMLKRTVRSVINMIKRWPNPEAAFAAIGRNPALFQDSSQFKKLIVQLANGDATDLKKLLSIHSSGYRFSNEEATELKEVLQAKLKQANLEEGYRADLVTLMAIFERGGCEAQMKRRAS